MIPPIILTASEHFLFSDGRLECRVWNWHVRWFIDCKDRGDRGGETMWVIVVWIFIFKFGNRILIFQVTPTKSGWCVRHVRKSAGSLRSRALESANQLVVSAQLTKGTAGMTKETASSATLLVSDLLFFQLQCIIHPLYPNEKHWDNNKQWLFEVKELSSSLLPHFVEQIEVSVRLFL